MRLFVAVARSGSFTEAARGLRLSPSVATRAVVQLEDRLGVALLQRTTRSVRLTEPGAAHLERCRRILDELDDAERALRGETAAPRGEMVIAAPIVFGRLHVLRVVSSLLRHNDPLSVRLVLSDRNARLAEDGIDVAVRIGALADSGLVARRLGAVGQVVVASPDYLAAHAAPACPAELAQHETVVFDGLGVTNEWRFRDEAVRIRPRLSVTTADAAVAAAEAGLGITRVLSYQVSEALHAGRLVPLLTAFAPAQMPVSALYQASRSTSANVAAFLSEARTYFANLSLAMPSDAVEGSGAHALAISGQADI